MPQSTAPGTPATERAWIWWLIGGVLGVYVLLGSLIGVDWVGA